MTKDELGNWGEEYSVIYLQKKGYEVVERNYRFQKNEIDIIAKFGNNLIIVEVKTRQTAEIGEPWRAVTKSKQKQIIKVANQYVQANQIELDVRFDIVSIVHNSYRTEIEHIEGAFDVLR
jgi:putative endonuclease